MPKIAIAKTRGLCKICSKTINIGTPIKWNNQTKSMCHKGCFKWQKAVKRSIEGNIRHPYGGMRS